MINFFRNLINRHHNSRSLQIAGPVSAPSNAFLETGDGGSTLFSTPNQSAGGSLSSATLPIPSARVAQTIELTGGTCRITEHKEDGQFSLVRKPVIKNLVFSGGGAKGVAYAGVLQAIEESPAQCASVTVHTLRDQIENVAGSSIGAIAAAFIATGVSGKVLASYAKEQDFQALRGDRASYKNPLKKDGVPLKNLINRSIKKGVRENIKKYCAAHGLHIEGTLPRGDAQRPVFTINGLKGTNNNSAHLTYEQQEKLAAIFNKIRVSDDKAEITFAEWNFLHGLDKSRFKSLYITAFCKETRKSCVFSHETHPDLGIATACRASASLPILLQAVEIDGLHYADGGLIHNLPTHIFENEKFMNLEGGQGNNLETLVLAFDGARESEGAKSDLQNPQVSSKQIYSPGVRDHFLLRGVVSLDGVHVPDGGRPRAKQEELLHVAHHYGGQGQVVPIQVPVSVTGFKRAKQHAATFIANAKVGFQKFYQEKRESNSEPEKHSSLDSLLFSLTEKELTEFKEQNRNVEERLKIENIRLIKNELKAIACLKDVPLKVKKSRCRRKIEFYAREMKIDAQAMKKYFASELSKALFKHSSGNDPKVIFDILVSEIDELIPKLARHNVQARSLVLSIRKQAHKALSMNYPESHEEELQKIVRSVLNFQNETHSELYPLNEFLNSIVNLIDFDYSFTELYKVTNKRTKAENMFLKSSNLGTPDKVTLLKNFSRDSSTTSHIRFVSSKRQFIADLLDL